MTLHFAVGRRHPADRRGAQRAAQVERAVVVPVALPPTIAAERRWRRGGLPPTGTPSDPLVGTSSQVVLNSGTGLENQWYVFRCNVNQAWQRSSGRNVVIGDVDWGFRTSHQDLATKIRRTYNAVDGTTDVTHGGSVFHGTGVTGLTGAAANSTGIAGIAYDAEIWGVQADSGTGPASGAIRGRAASTGSERPTAAAGAKCASWRCRQERSATTSRCPRSTPQSRRRSRRRRSCVAAGNGNKEPGSTTRATPYPRPARYSSAPPPTSGGEQARLVQQLRPADHRGRPGDSAHDLTCTSSGDTAYSNGFGGTSGATPKVAGVAALMLAANPELSHADVRRILNVTGAALTPDPGKPVGTFLDAGAAVRQAAVGASGRLEVFARGTDKALWHNWQTAPNNGWSGWASVGGWITSETSAATPTAGWRCSPAAPTARSGTTGRPRPTAAGPAGPPWAAWVDKRSSHQQERRRPAGGVRPRHGQRAVAHLADRTQQRLVRLGLPRRLDHDDLAVAQNADGRLEVFARGTDKALWHIWQTAPNNGWSGWASLGGWIDRLAPRPQRRRPAGGLRPRLRRRGVAQLADRAQQRLVRLGLPRRLDRPARRRRERRRPAGGVRPRRGQGAVAHLADRAQQRLVRLGLPRRLDRPARTPTRTTTAGWRCSPAARTRRCGTSGRPHPTTAGPAGGPRVAGSTCWTSATTPSEGSPAVAGRWPRGPRRENCGAQIAVPLSASAPSTARVTHVGKALRIWQDPDARPQLGASNARRNSEVVQRGEGVRLCHP